MNCRCRRHVLLSEIFYCFIPLFAPHFAPSCTYNTPEYRSETRPSLALNTLHTLNTLDQSVVCIQVQPVLADEPACCRSSPTSSAVAPPSFPTCSLSYSVLSELFSYVVRRISLGRQRRWFPKGGIQRVKRGIIRGDIGDRITERRLPFLSDATSRPE